MEEYAMRALIVVMASFASCASNAQEVASNRVECEGKIGPAGSRYLGGVCLQDAHGLSGLDIVGDTLVAVSDRNAWLQATLEWDQAGSLHAVRDSQTRRIILPSKYKTLGLEAEDLCKAEGGFLVSFEWKDRSIFRKDCAFFFRGNANGATRAIGELKFERASKKDNAGWEGVARLRSSTLLLTEEFAEKGNANRPRTYEANYFGSQLTRMKRLTIKSSPFYFGNSGCSAIPETKYFAILQRSRDLRSGSKTYGSGARVLAVANSRFGKDTVLVNESDEILKLHDKQSSFKCLHAEHQTTVSVGNVEGVAARASKKPGVLELFLLTDDSSGTKVKGRTLLLHFEVPSGLLR